MRPLKRSFINSDIVDMKIIFFILGIFVPIHLRITDY